MASRIVEGSLIAGVLAATFDPDQLDSAALIKATTDAGYPSTARK